MDLDFQSSHVCDYLDIAPKFQFDEMNFGTPGRLDDQLMGAFMSHMQAELDGHFCASEPQPVSAPAISASKLSPPFSMV